MPWFRGLVAAAPESTPWHVTERSSVSSASHHSEVTSRYRLIYRLVSEARCVRCSCFPWETLHAVASHVSPFSSSQIHVQKVEKLQKVWQSGQKKSPDFCSGGYMHRNPLRALQLHTSLQEPLWSYVNHCQLWPVSFRIRHAGKSVRCVACSPVRSLVS